MNKKSISVLIVFFLSLSFLEASDSAMSRVRYGAFFNFRLNNHYSNFTKLPDIPNCCPEFKGGNGTGFSLGLLWELPLPYRLHLGLKGGYSVFDADLKSNEPVLVKIDNYLVNGLFEHVIESRLSDVFAEPYITYNLFRGLEIYGGLHLGYYMTKELKQYEHIVSPADRGVFQDTKTRYRNEYNGDIPDAVNMYQGYQFGLNYHLPLNKESSFFLVPDLSYIYGTTNIVKELEWKANTLQFGLALKYSPKPSAKEIKIYEKQIIKENTDTITFVSADVLQKSIFRGVENSRETRKQNGDTVYILINKSRTDTLKLPPVPTVSISANTPLIYFKTQYVSQVFPLLPVVFFAHNSSEIAAEYKMSGENTSFSEEDLPPSPLLLHKNILNIIGQRLNLHPDANIALTAYSDEKSEGGNCTLAIDRAKAVRKFLKENWGIDENRIPIIASEKNCSPPEPTYTDNDSGYAENRRLDIHGDNELIMAPIVKKKFLELKNISPGELKINPAVTNEKSIASWNLIGKQGDKILFTQSGTGAPTMYQRSISESDMNVFDQNETLSLELIIRDYENREYSAKTSIKIVKDTSDVEIQRLSLILFGVNSGELSDASKTALKSFMKSSKDYKKVNIKGYSDILGTAAFNKQLSEKRALNTANLIKDIVPDVKMEETKGYGNEELPPGIESYNSPAERFLTRTVYIELEKRIK